MKKHVQYNHIHTSLSIYPLRQTPPIEDKHFSFQNENSFEKFPDLISTVTSINKENLAPFNHVCHSDKVIQAITDFILSVRGDYFCVCLGGECLFLSNKNLKGGFIQFEMKVPSFGWNMDFTEKWPMTESNWLCKNALVQMN